MKKGDIVRICIGVILLLALILSLIFIKPVKAWTLVALDKIASFGWYGNLIIIGLFILTAITALAGAFAVLCFGSGFAYGVRIGVPTALLGSFLGAICAFIIGRTLLRKMIQRWIKRSSNLQAVDRMVQERGVVGVILVRLAILPPNLMNYFFAITGVKVPAYIIGSCIGLTPGILVLSFLGASVRHCDCNSEPEWLRICLYVTLGITALLTIIFSIWARKAIKKYKEEEKLKKAAESTPVALETSPLIN